jgi:hypothetical protein
MLKKNLLGILALTALAALAGACSDNDNDNAVVLDGRVAVIDTDGNLVVSVPEWNAAFAVFDVNGDGRLTASEFRFNATGFVSADVNGDAFVTQAEWDATLTIWDANADHLLERAEFDPYL